MPLLLGTLYIIKMLKILSIILASIAGISCMDFSNHVTAKTRLGPIQGHYSNSYGGKTFIEFLGVPYAKPPMGNLRFEDPKPAEPWTGTWIANQTSSCLQVNHWPTQVGGVTLGQEDCLHLNIFVPGQKIFPTALKDVIIHIHGGCFMCGSGLSYAGPKYLMDRDVIFININYRLGLSGFLSTEDEHLPGNRGMKDQVMALKWIKDNIKYFGGNPDSITITGLSAGGASVQYHLLSPLSRGLYSKAISVSGCSLNPWTLQENAANKTRAVAKAVGCDLESTKDMVACLKRRNPYQINEATRMLRTWIYNPYSPVAVIVDKWSKNPFLPEHPYKMLSEGNVNDIPWIVSATTSEGLYPAIDFSLKDEYLPQLEENWGKYADDILHYTDTIPKESQEEVAQKIKEYYLQGKTISKDTYLEVIQIVSDRLFVVGLDVAARLHSKAVKSPVYFYVYDYMGEQRESFAYMFSKSLEKYGVCHGDDLMFVFSNCFPDKRMTKKDEQMKEFFLDMWTSFAKNGNLAISGWTPVSKNITDDLNYLYIVGDSQQMMKAPELGHRSFWESIAFEESENLFRDTIKYEL